MRKKVIAGLAAVMAVGMFTGCGVIGRNDIGRDAALEAALDDAGVSESDTTRLKVSEDNDDGRKVYEIRFDAGEKEYDYEVAASDGRIISADVELINSMSSSQNSGTQGSTSDGQTDGSAGQNQQGQQSQTGTNNAEAAVSLEEAAAIALERVPGAAQSDIRIELDYDDGVYKYEGDIIYEQREYDFEIDANTGTILEWSEERA